MNTVNALRRTARNAFAVALVCLVTSLPTETAFAQTSEPYRDQLLNGLRILLWSRPGDQNVLLKLRIHSGAAFDMAGKGGTMALLGDALFPDAATHEYFTEEMGGQLNVVADYDSIDIILQGRASDYDRIIDILRGALVTTPLTPENVTKVREARIKALSDTKHTAVDVADWSLAFRLFGRFPYAHPVAGTAESLGRVERADLMLARERFLNPNNATLVIVGGVDQRRAMRALKQLLGGWRKSEQVVPATFREPDPPDPRVLIVNSPGPQTAEVRLATRGVARSDGDYFAATLLAVVARDRWQKLFPDLNKSSFFVRQEAHFLPGVFVMGASVDNASAAKTLEAARNVLQSLISMPVSTNELEMAKSNALAVINGRLSKTETMADVWLDIDTYSLPSVNEQMRASNAVSLADLQRVAIRLFREVPTASVVVGSADQLKAELAATEKVEVMGEVAAPKAPEQKSTTNAAPQTRKPTPILITPKSTNPLIKTTKPPPRPD